MTGIEQHQPGRRPRLILLLALTVSALLPALAMAHEVRPAYLRLTEAAPGQFTVLWKQPVLDDRRLPLEPRLPADCRELERALPDRTAGALLERWRVECDLRTGQISITGLSRTLTDALLTIEYLDGDSQQLLLKPEAPAFDLASDAPGLVSYLTLGIEHLLSGIDHVLFVILLVFYVHGPWNLLKTVTAFTVAHSMTLSAAVMDWIRLPQAPVEAVIALSILYLARELMLPEDRRSPLTQAQPWLMAFSFGLLHGFGFAGALKDIGLPDNLVWVALLLFNLGVELGQLLLIAALLLLAWLAHRLLRGESGAAATGPMLSGSDSGPTPPLVAALSFAALAGAGAVAGYWTIDRCLPLLL